MFFQDRLHVEGELAEPLVDAEAQPLRQGLHQHEDGDLGPRFHTFVRLGHGLLLVSERLECE
jgi:hypothetical protein